MRFRSTGLGKTELVGDLVEMSPSGQGALVTIFQTTKPVQWKLTAALEPSDIPPLLKAVVKPSVLLMLVRCLLYQKKNPNEPVDILNA